MRAPQLLLIEGNPSDAVIAKQVIESLSEDIEVTHISDGEEALNLLKKNADPQFDLILLDLQLPSPSGKDVLAAIRQNPFRKDTPVIVLTASVTDQDFKDVELLGASFILIKGVNGAHHFSLNLKNLIRSWLEVTRLSAPIFSANDNSNRKILLVEDNSADALLICRKLAQQGFENYEVHQEKTLESALEIQDMSQFDAAILDLSLPDSSGIETVRKFMASVGNVLPVVVFTASDDSEFGMEAIRLGAQDYLMKRSSEWQRLGQTLAFAINRTKNVKKSESPNFLEYTVKDAKVRVNVINQSLSVTVEEKEEKSPRLTRLEFKLVSFLLKNCGQTISRQRLLEELWVDDVVKPNHRIVDAVVSSIKKKSALFSDQIETVYGTGYRLKA